MKILADARASSVSISSTFRFKRLRFFYAYRTCSRSIAQVMDYGTKFNVTTSGKGRLKLTLNGYKKRVTNEGKIRKRKGVSPLDEAQWILHNQRAFKAGDQ